LLFRGKAIQPWDGKDPQIFAPLTADEMIKVNEFMITNKYADNVSAMSSLSLKIDFLTFMYLYLPNKTAVLEYKTGQGEYPGRYAGVLFFIILLIISITCISISINLADLLRKKNKTHRSTDLS
jgi:uncharacterized membrane protein YozB (DUF420 family)